MGIGKTSEMRDTLAQADGTAAVRLEGALLCRILLLLRTLLLLAFLLDLRLTRLDVPRRLVHLGIVGQLHGVCMQRGRKRNAHVVDAARICIRRDDLRGAHSADDGQGLLGGIEPLDRRLGKLVPQLQHLAASAGELCRGSRAAGDKRRDGRRSVDRDPDERKRQQRGVDDLPGRHELRDGVVCCQGSGIGHVLNLSSTRADDETAHSDEQQATHDEEGDSRSGRRKAAFLPDEYRVHAHAPIHPSGDAPASSTHCGAQLPDAETLCSAQPSPAR